MMRNFPKWSEQLGCQQPGEQGDGLPLGAAGALPRHLGWGQCPGFPTNRAAVHSRRGPSMASGNRAVGLQGAIRAHVQSSPESQLLLNAGQLVEKAKQHPTCVQGCAG